jgi:hypothetical protein
MDRYSLFHRCTGGDITQTFYWIDDPEIWIGPDRKQGFGKWPKLVTGEHMTGFFESEDRPPGRYLWVAPPNVGLVGIELKHFPENRMTQLGPFTWAENTYGDYKVELVPIEGPDDQSIVENLVQFRCSEGIWADWLDRTWTDMLVYPWPTKKIPSQSPFRSGVAGDVLDSDAY